MTARRIKQPITVTLPPEFIQRIDTQKERENRSASEIVRDALRLYYQIGVVNRVPSDRAPRLRV